MGARIVGGLCCGEVVGDGGVMVDKQLVIVVCERGWLVICVVAVVGDGGVKVQRTVVVILPDI